MGLYLTIFDGQTELDGFEPGSYQDFDDFRQTIVTWLEGGKQGSTFPVLQLHSDCDGEWSVRELTPLLKELDTIKTAFLKLDPKMPAAYEGIWQGTVLEALGIDFPDSLHASFFDCNGEAYLDGLIRLVKLGLNKELPILFQ